MATIQLRLLGTFQLRVNGQIRDEFRSQLVRALLAYLVLEGGKQPLSRRQLANLFWEGYDQHSGLASFRVALSNIRRLLAPLDLIHTTRRTVRFDGSHPNFWCDALALEDLSTSGFNRHLFGQLQDVLGISQVSEPGPETRFLAGFDQIGGSFHAWLQSRRMDYDGMLVLAQHRSLTGNLPRALTSFLGREQEIAQIKKLLAAPNGHLLTLLGEGGVGKTRLALEVARQLQHKFVDGVWLVELAGKQMLTPSHRSLHAVHDDNDVAVATANALGIRFHHRERAGNELADKIVAFLRTKNALLIFDGFEAYDEQAGFILDLLHATDRLKVIVTSQRPLDALAEQCFQVQALPVPEEPSRRVTTKPHDVAQMRAFASASLFVARARAVRPDFELNTENYDAVAEICRAVGGLPLAIELAAAQVRYASCQQILVALRQDLTALSASMLDLPTRHLSMETVVAASWQLLTQEQARVLAQCAIFSGGFTAQAAQEVAAADMETLVSLVELSVLQIREGGRFDMHDLVRQVAMRRLHEEKPDAEISVRERHCLYFINYLKTAASGLWSTDHDRQQILAEFDNLRDAWHWAVETAQPNLLAQGRPALFELFDVTGHGQEAVRAAGQAAEMLDTQLANQNQSSADLWQMLAMLRLDESRFYWKMGQLAQAEASAMAAREIGDKLDAAALQARVCYEMSHIASRRGDYAASMALANRGFIYAQMSGTVEMEIACKVNLGSNALSMGDLKAAARHCYSALMLARTVDNPRQLAAVLTPFALSQFFLVKPDAAMRYFGQALAIHRRLNDNYNVCQTLVYRATCQERLGNYSHAQRDADEAHLIAQEIGDSYLECLSLTFKGIIAWRTEDLALARQFYGQAVMVALANDYRDLYLYTLTYLAWLMVSIGHQRDSHVALQRALNLTRQHHRRSLQVRVHCGLAESHLLHKDLTTAQAEVHEILQLMPAIEDEIPFAISEILLTCYRVLAASRHIAAEGVLRRAYDAMSQRANCIHDATLRRAYLKNVPANRQIATLISNQLYVMAT